MSLARERTRTRGLKLDVTGYSTRSVDLVAKIYLQKEKSAMRLPFECTRSSSPFTLSLQEEWQFWDRKDATEIEPSARSLSSHRRASGWLKAPPN